MRRIAIVSTHPIQYYAPWFALLAKEKDIELKVFYTFSQRQTDLFDNQFGQKIEWDIPLLEGYNFDFVLNTSSKPDLGNFWGVKCPALIEKIEVWEATHILIFGWNYHAHLRVMRHFKNKIPVWFRGDSTLLDEKSGLKLILRRLFLKWVYSYVDYAFYVGTNNKKYFEVHGLKENQLLYTPHAIDNERFFDNAANQYEIKAKAWRRNLNIDEDSIVILFAGKFDQNKNPDFLINAIQAYNGLSPQKIKLLLIGSGPLESKLNEMIVEDENIQLLPFQNQSIMPVVYRLGNIYCMPSYRETWGLAINEAMACGIPIICSDNIGATIDLIINGQNGFTFNANNLESLISILKKMHNTDVIKKMGKKSQDIIKNWSFKKITESIINQSLKK